jgi:poly(A) polymerase
MSGLTDALNRIRRATAGTPYEGALYIVGGYVRDRLLGREPNEDLDIVLEGDAIALARFLHERGLSSHHPVEYPRFGTVRIDVEGVPTEIVSARAESYESESRKPHTQPATLKDDALRRDFTVNTLIENLHNGRRLDLLGVGEADLRARVIRTPLDPDATFSDDPLRMLRAVRMATVLGFEIDPDCWSAIGRNLNRLKIISMERIRDEFLKIVGSPQIARGMNLLRECGLLDRFLPELSAMYGVTQNDFHLHDVWGHTLAAFDGLAEDAPLAGRLALLFHDVGKPATRTVGVDGFVHFYQHELVGAEMTREALRRLKLANDEIEQVVGLVSLHMRIGHYSPEWGDSAVRRLIRDAGERLDDLCALYDADRSATNLTFEGVQLEEFRARVDAIKAKEDILALDSPLDGREIMELLGIEAGPLVGEVKDYLLNEVIEGRLAQDDKPTARSLVLTKWPRREGGGGREDQAPAEPQT